MWREIGRWSERDLDRADLAYGRWMRQEMAGRRFMGLVVEDRDGRPAGSGAIWLSPNQPRPGRLATTKLPYILSMFTEPEFRNRGVASSLVRAMVRWAETRGHPRIYLHASRKGRPVYARLGFREGNEMRLDLALRRRR